MKQWMYRQSHADLQKLSEAYGISEIMAEILVKRGLTTWEGMNQYLYPSLEKLASPELMKDMDKALGILEQKLRQHKKIGIIGDYDVDGVMSTSILYLGLQELGADVTWRIPHRVRDGYGIRGYMAEEAKADGVDTIITCDNGISATDAISRAKELEMTVIVTDHHEVPLDLETGEEILPLADAIVDPKQSACGYPCKILCGAGVAYRLIEALWKKMGCENQTLQEELLTFAGIATVCDVVPLQQENRIIVRRGLELIQDTTNIGLKALIEQQNFERDINSTDLGFRIGPCLNAAGRLADAALGVELLLEKDSGQAQKKAAQLVEWNEQRKELTAQATEEAIEQIEKEGYLENPVLVVYLENCHESVAGIVAGRIREKYYRPTMIVTDSGNHLKGSGRSVPEYHMQSGLNQCQEYLIEFGGHALAAGFSLERDQLENLRRELNVRSGIQVEQLIEKITLDREVPLGQVDQKLLLELQLLQPVGEGNASPLFAERKLRVKSVRLFGKENQIGRFRVCDKGKWYDIVDFNVELHMKETLVQRYSETAWNEIISGIGDYEVDILYAPSRNAKYGDVQYQVVDCR